jgi:hypothetical protein
VTQGSADLGLIPLTEGDAPAASTSDEVSGFIEFVKEVLKDEVSDVRASERLTARGMVAPEHGMDRQLEKLLAASGRGGTAARPVLEINLVTILCRSLPALLQMRTCARTRLGCFSTRRGLPMVSFRPIRAVSPPDWEGSGRRRSHSACPEVWVRSPGRRSDRANAGIKRCLVEARLTGSSR